MMLDWILEWEASYVSILWSLITLTDGSHFTLPP